MDTTDPDIVFDEEGVSNWWHDFRAIRNREPSTEEKQRNLRQLIAQIKRSGEGRPYDCLIGLSGGVDSSYLAILAAEWGLRPLILHFDNGWNDELAVGNIERIVNGLGFKLKTFVMDWPEFRDLQRSYFQASVLDLDIPSDHMIFGALYKTASEKGINYILSGNNFATEWLLPRRWYYPKRDLTNLKNIHAQFGERPVKKLPKIGVWQYAYYERLRGVQVVEPLNLLPYKKIEAKAMLTSKLGWRDYGGKHYESVFTRFYQGYILPHRYGIDKRKAHLSNLICNGEISRDEALGELEHPPDSLERVNRDKRYVAKKLGWPEEELDQIIDRPHREHTEFGTDRRSVKNCERFCTMVRPFAKLLRSIARA